VAGFQTAFEALEKHMQRLTLHIAKVLAHGLGLEDKEYVVKWLQNLENPQVPNTTTLRALCCPKVGDEVKNHKNPTHCAAHTDYGFITFFFD